MVEVSDETQDGVVLKELQPGYMLQGSLLRPARVVVGQYGSSPEPAAPAAPTESQSPPAADSASQNEKDQKWETDEVGRELEFGEEGLDFSGE